VTQPDRSPEKIGICPAGGTPFVIGGALRFLPVPGIGMLPLGLVPVAQDPRFLRKPVGRAMIRLDRGWAGLRRRWKGS
jgi:hypothetical protein